ncbi:MAG TPA: helix-turn-helix domain-containing protein [Candidatus Jeotgalibaca merdavium]|uniref:Helix-turn-helix domain-containing protein n=1 Tax=Candidatus Jeotgalibaca merdavium TaxID=2838627 RepID=A0A9D2KXU1_9LACT|nr:helix-turn-helix domain-containing protein [Candidatus Jeotgalibaca merdavium]
MNVGERIKYRRKELGLNADYLADYLGVSRSTVFRYEKGEIEKLPTEILEKLAEVLHTTPGYLMGWEETSNDNKIINLFRQLHDSRQKRVIEFTEKQLEEQNNVIEFKRTDIVADNTLAAHLVDPSKEFTDDQIDGLKAYLDKARDEYFRKYDK